jgi:hypothetical protein
MYAATLILAVAGSEHTMNLFMLSILLTILVPLIIHLFLMMLNVRKGRGIMDETYTYREKKNADTAANPGTDADPNTDALSEPQSTDSES